MAAGYPNILTPPSGDESPQPVYFIASPTSNSFQDPENYADQGFSIIPQATSGVDSNLVNNAPAASLHLLEQPTDRFRFRYKSEMAGTHGSLTGYTSDKTRKQTYPTVELRNFTGPAIIRCSIYQLNEKGNDFKPHAHRLIMKRGREERDDPHDLLVGPEESYRAVFHGMGIIHTAKKNIVVELVRKKTQLMKEHIARTEGKIRELHVKEQVEIKGLAEAESKSINLNIVCLRFDAFFKQDEILFPICAPIYSHGINNLKSALTGDLKIVRLDHVVSPAKGGKEVFILVERVTKKNIKIRFFELDDEENVVWEDYGRFNDLDVHHQYAIVFKTPKYRDENITQPVKVFVELLRPSDNARSEPRDFKFVPNKKIPKPGQKRPRYDYTSSSSYDSSNADTDQLPLVISNLHLENEFKQSNGSLNIPSFDDDTVMKAMNNMNSDEFQQIFHEIGPEYLKLLDPNTIDAPRSLNAKDALRNYSIMRKAYFHSQLDMVKQEVSDEEKRMAVRVVEELKSFFQTTHTVQRAIEILRHYLGEDRKTNALHVCISQLANQDSLFLLKMLAKCQHLDLFNITNMEGLTYLHIAVLSNNEFLVKFILLCRAKVTVIDSDLNTALHLAVKTKRNIGIIEVLLSRQNVSEFIDITNSDGNTALMLAVEENYIQALQLLCKKKADVNKQHSKNGFVPLRIAIEKQNWDIVKYLLSLPHLDATIKDFRGTSPFGAVTGKELPRNILDMIQQYMKNTNIQIEIKEEIDEDSEDDEPMDECEIKSEPISKDELTILYEKVHKFTPQCLDKVANILDESGRWEDLADLLDIGHMIKSGIIHSDVSISKAMLTYATETNEDKPWIIRNFLENLDETQAVEIIDKMVLDFS